MWGGFVVVVLFFLALDLGVFQKESHTPTFREALLKCGFWVCVAGAFNLVVYYEFGTEKALEFLAGYIIEQALSIDNVFVFIILFSYFKVPEQYQHRVLFYGILGAIVMRALFVVLGAELLANFHWMTYVFGLILIVSGIKLAFGKSGEMDPSHNPFLRIFRAAVRVTPEYHGERFFIRSDKQWMATPLCLVLVAIEITDVVFALDSVPAVFAISKDPFIVFSSNICAILGLRAYFFLLSGAIQKIVYLKTGLALILSFVGIKMLASSFIEIPTPLSLGVILSILAGTFILSSLYPPKVKAPLGE